MLRKILGVPRRPAVASLRRRRLTVQHELAPLDPRAEPVEIHSAALGIPKRFYVYAPRGALGRRQRLPVLYLFRGHEHEWVNRQQDDSRAGRTVIDVYEELLLAGVVGPMLLVFPGISSDDNSVSGLMVNFKHPEIGERPGLGRGQFEDYFVRELMPAVDARWGTRPAARALDGFSLGGFMAVKLAARYPEHFRSVGAYDGLYFWDDPADAASIAHTDRTFRNPMFDAAFGTERDRRYAAANNPLNLVRGGDAARLGRLTWLIEHGPEAGEPYDSNFFRGERLLELLAGHGIPNQGRGELRTASHTWHHADEHIRHVLPLHWRALTAGS